MNCLLIIQISSAVCNRITISCTTHIPEPPMVLGVLNSALLGLNFGFIILNTTQDAGGVHRRLTL